MRLAARLRLACILGLTVAAAIAAGAQEPQGGPAMPLGSGPGPDQFNGLWDYNDLESINVATGRPEQSPAAARRAGPGAQRTPPGPGANTGAPAGTGTRTGPGVGGFGDPNFGQGRNDEIDRRADAMYRALMQAELRALMRDLLEVPETLSFRVEPNAVTIADDLDRRLVFATDSAKMQKYQLSASKFEARAYWDGRVLHKSIEGPRGFRMNEQYFLSQDGRRLFVIIRLGEPKPDAPPVGANRVYERVNN